MNKEDLKKRFFQWVLSVLDILKKIPFNEESKVFKNQLIRSSTSSAANYRAACRAKSTRDMINKLKIVEEELGKSKIVIRKYLYLKLITPYFSLYHFKLSTLNFKLS